MKWFKFYGQDWLTDMKIMSMSMEDRLCYITLLALASSADNDGTIKSCNEDALIRLSNIPEDIFNEVNPTDRARGCLKRYEALHCVTLHDNGDVTINNFERRQGEFLSNAERQKNYRDRQKVAKTKDKINIHKRNDSNVTPRNDSNARVDKKREEKNIYTGSLSYLTNIPEQELKEFTERFDASIGAIKSKAEDLLNYCKSKGKVYKDYRAFLLNALKKDFKPRQKQAFKPEDNSTPEDIERTRKARAEISSMLANKFKIND